MKKSDKHLKYISHGIYLQIFLGIGYIILHEIGVTPPDFNNDGILGGMLVFLGLNSLIYINKYKKALTKEENEKD